MVLRTIAGPEPARPPPKCLIVNPPESARADHRQVALQPDRNLSYGIVRNSIAMNATAKLSELLDSIEFESESYITNFDRQTGRIVMVERSLLEAVEEGGDDDLPKWDKEDIELARAICTDTTGRFVDPPDKFDFHEYHHMERFIGTVEKNADAEDLWRAIKGKGAFRYFKDTAGRLGLLDRWYQYRDAAVRKFVVAWAETNEVPFEDDTAKRGR